MLFLIFLLVEFFSKSLATDDAITFEALYIVADLLTISVFFE